MMDNSFQYTHLVSLPETFNRCLKLFSRTHVKNKDTLAQTFPFKAKCDMFMPIFLSRNGDKNVPNRDFLPIKGSYNIEPNSWKFRIIRDIKKSRKNFPPEKRATGVLSV